VKGRCGRQIMRRFASKLQRMQLYILQDGLCNICRDGLEECFEVDHLIPFSQGGPTLLWNLQALCPDCHSEKSRASDRREP
jgi:5-methylcytosine-specific restriction endonuclease McrA